MGFFKQKNRQMEILQKMQENLEKSEQNIADVAEMICVSTEGKGNNTEKNKLEQENIDKFKAAYALNLCTVSVSQIIDYNDIYFLEQEYDAILNNLNLEEMPKDEELLNILKQILDVITYFRIQEGDKKMMEKEYQHQMQNAIWNAVPKFGLVVASSDPWSMAVSLASQVGIGYMNYRRAKAENILEREKKEWELQRSAMEQFNGLRRELFDTAWRLAEKYNFPEEYRLTERQITQYNEMLMDSDYLRRYERLEYICDKFKAYPPFWYYFGNAANKIAQDESFDKNIRDSYKKKAIEHFAEFIRNTENNLLREDQLLAAGALELFDIIDEKNLEKVGTLKQLDEYKEDLLKKAVKASGNAYDVLQLCALSYLKINKTEQASKILNMLVNADYNKIVNAQLLSHIYVLNYINLDSSEAKEKYTILQQRISPQYLMPMPARKDDGAAAEQEFLEAQKENLLYKYTLVIATFIEKYEYSHDILNKEATLKRITEVYQSICILPFITEDDKADYYQKIAKSIQKNKNEFNEENSHDFCGVFKIVFENVFEIIADNIAKKIKNLNKLSDISDMELNLKDFCVEAKIEEPILIFDDTYNLSTNVERVFDESILFDGKNDELERIEQRRNMLEIITEVKFDELFVKDADSNIKNIEFYKAGEDAFNSYIKRRKLENKEKEIIAVLNDRTMSDIDLIFTTSGIFIWSRILKAANLVYPLTFFVKGIYYSPYNSIERDNSHERKIVIGGYHYDNKRVNLDVLYELIKKLDNRKGKTEESMSAKMKQMILDAYNSEEMQDS